MSKGRAHNQTGRSTREARHVRLYHWLMETAAWKSLGPTERALYVELARRYIGTNNGRIILSVRDAATELRLGHSTVQRALQALQDRGFIVVVRKGHFWGQVRTATEWRLTEFNCDVTGALATKEFTRWQPEKQNSVPPEERVVPLQKPARTATGTR